MDKFFSDQIRQSNKTKAGDEIKSRDDGVTGNEAPKKFPKGVVLGKDGKPYDPSCLPFVAAHFTRKRHQAS